MFTRFFLSISIAGFSLHANAQLKRFSFTEQKMGSPLMIVMYCTDSAQASTLARQSFQLVDSFNHIFSDYDSSSELMQLNAVGQSIHTSPVLWQILLESKNAYEKSSGAFDITVGPLVKEWRRARKAKQFPSQQKIDSIKKLTGFSSLSFDTVQKKILLKKGMSLDLGGIAKGWIAQKVINFLKEQQVPNALADAGGDIVIGDAPPTTAGWSIGINVPESKEDLLAQSLLLQNKAVATSGDAYQFIEKDGKRYSHITDPKTGYGVTFQRNVTIIANDGSTADWLATACSILPIKKAKKLAASMQAELLIAENRNNKIIFYSTGGFAQYWNRNEK